jgi:hypothetical protein
MAKNRIVASRLLQIVGFEGDVEPGTVLAEIDTDCEIGALLSALQFGGAEIEREDSEQESEAQPEPEAPAKPPRKSSRRSR